MSKNLTALIADVQALLLDDGTKFSSATTTAAIRQALHCFNERAPIWKTATITVVSGQTIYPLSTIPDLVDVYLVTLDDDYLPFNYYVDNLLRYFRIDFPVNSDMTLVYKAFHTIQDLDAATAGTMSARHEQVLCDLAAGIASVIRSGGRVESNNLNANVGKEYRSTWELWRQTFELGITAIQHSEPAPMLVSNMPHWTDGWENF